MTIPWDSEEVRAAHARLMSEMGIRPDYSVDVRRAAMEGALAAFERERDPSVAYSGPHMVERDGCYFIEWRPVGFVIPVDGAIRPVHEEAGSDSLVQGESHD